MWKTHIGATSGHRLTAGSVASRRCSAADADREDRAPAEAVERCALDQHGLRRPLGIQRRKSPLPPASAALTSIVVHAPAAGSDNLDRVVGDAERGPLLGDVGVERGGGGLAVADCVCRGWRSPGRTVPTAAAAAPSRPATAPGHRRRRCRRPSRRRQRIVPSTMSPKSTVLAPGSATAAPTAGAPASAYVRAATCLAMRLASRGSL